jgi:predicted RNA-binding protein with PUA-like domain
MAYPDPTATEDDWSAVDLVPLKPLTRPITLADIKTDAVLKNMAFVRQSRLSVSPVAADEAARLLALAQTKL